MNKTIKKLKQKKNSANNVYVQDGGFESNFVFLKTLVADLNELISSTKDFCYDNLANNEIICC